MQSRECTNGVLDFFGTVFAIFSMAFVMVAMVFIVYIMCKVWRTF